MEQKCVFFHLQHRCKLCELPLSFSTSSLYASSAVIRSFFAPSNTANLTPAHPPIALSAGVGQSEQVLASSGRHDLWSFIAQTVSSYADLSPVCCMSAFTANFTIPMC